MSCLLFRRNRVGLFVLNNFLVNINYYEHFCYKLTLLYELVSKWQGNENYISITTTLKFSLLKSKNFCYSSRRNCLGIFFSKYILLQTFLIQLNINLPTGIKMTGQIKFCIMYCSIKNFQYSNPIISGIFWEPLYIFYFSVKLQKSLQN